MDDLVTKLAKMRLTRTQNQNRLRGAENPLYRYNLNRTTRPGAIPGRAQIRTTIKDRDLAIAKFIAIGATNNEITSLFGISTSTIHHIRNSPITRKLIDAEREKIFAADDPKRIFRSLMEAATRNLSNSLTSDEFRERQWATDTVFDRVLGKPTNRTETTDTTVRDLFTELARHASIPTQPVIDITPNVDGPNGATSSADLPPTVPDPSPDLPPDDALAEGQDSEPPPLEAEFSSDVAAETDVAELPNVAGSNELSDDDIATLVHNL